MASVLRQPRPSTAAAVAANYDDDNYNDFDYSGGYRAATQGDAFGGMELAPYRGSAWRTGYGFGDDYDGKRGGVGRRRRRGAGRSRRRRRVPGLLDPYHCRDYFRRHDHAGMDEDDDDEDHDDFTTRGRVTIPLIVDVGADADADSDPKEAAAEAAARQVGTATISVRGPTVDFSFGVPSPSFRGTVGALGRGGSDSDSGAVGRNQTRKGSNLDDDDDDDDIGVGSTASTYSSSPTSWWGATLFSPRASFAYGGGARGGGGDSGGGAYGTGRAVLGWDWTSTFGTTLGCAVGSCRREIFAGATVAEPTTIATYRAGVTSIYPASGSSLPPALAFDVSVDRPLSLPRYRGNVAAEMADEEEAEAEPSTRGHLSLRLGTDGKVRGARIGVVACGANSGEDGADPSASSYYSSSPLVVSKSKLLLCLEAGYGCRPIRTRATIEPNPAIGEGGGGGGSFGLANGRGPSIDASIEWGPQFETNATILLRRSVGPPDLAWFGIGLTRAAGIGGGALAWLFRFERGDIRLDVPVSFVCGSSSSSSAATAAAVGAGGSAFATTAHSFFTHLFQAAYLSLLSVLVDGAVVDLLSGVTKGRTSQSRGGGGIEENEEEGLDPNARRRAARLLRREKDRADAERQTRLMERQAEFKRKAEEGRGGLVIVRAIYGVPSTLSRGGGTEEGGVEGGMRRPHIDVTTQLQFWVTNSTLRLPPSSKKNLLGFYDVADDISYPTVPERKGPQMSTLSWAQLWRSCSLFTRRRTKTTPVLDVRYMFEGAMYVIRVKDEDALLLPNPNAKLVR